MKKQENEKNERIFLKRGTGNEYILVWVSIPTLGSFCVDQTKVKTPATLIRVDIMDRNIFTVATLNIFTLLEGS